MKRFICSILMIILSVSMVPSIALADNGNLKAASISSQNAVQVGDIISDGQAEYEVVRLYDPTIEADEFSELAMYNSNGEVYYSVRGAVLDEDGSTGHYNGNAVKLVRWLNGTSVSFVGQKFVTIDGVKYFVEEVAPNAFNNEAGKKVKKITFSTKGSTAWYTKFTKGSFYGMSGLKDVYISPTQRENIWHQFALITYDDMWDLGFYSVKFYKSLFNNKNKVNIHITEFTKQQKGIFATPEKKNSKKTHNALHKDKTSKKTYNWTLKKCAKYLGFKKSKITINKKNYNGKKFYKVKPWWSKKKMNKLGYYYPEAVSGYQYLIKDSKDNSLRQVGMWQFYAFQGRY